jgi:hypothetical protein
MTSNLKADITLAVHSHDTAPLTSMVAANWQELTQNEGRAWAYGLIDFLRDVILVDAPEIVGASEKQADLGRQRRRSRLGSELGTLLMDFAQRGGTDFGAVFVAAGIIGIRQLVETKTEAKGWIEDTVEESSEPLIEALLVQWQAGAK